MKRDSAFIVAVLTGIAAVMGVAFLVTFSTAVSLAQEGKPKDAKPIFTKFECNGCHSLQAAGIKKQVSAESGEEDAPDLSGVGTKRTADWIAKFLLKKETIDGKKHEKKFKGSTEELDTLSKWLATMKSGSAGKK
ncbi:MAG: c-type cytochrome [Candidatus Latescibacteria bacterium]|nr:c-type cytochrome [Candidatus Latescibacterota bacterium]